MSANLSIINNDPPEMPPAPPIIPPPSQPTWSYVRVQDIEMSFGSMVTFMVKWAFASIPAVIIIVMISFAIFLGLTILTGLTQ
jgi:hypothetical protein